MPMNSKHGSYTIINDTPQKKTKRTWELHEENNNWTQSLPSEQRHPAYGRSQAKNDEQVYQSMNESITTYAMYFFCARIRINE